MVDSGELIGNTEHLAL